MTIDKSFSFLPSEEKRLSFSLEEVFIRAIPTIVCRTEIQNPLYSHQFQGDVAMLNVPVACCYSGEIQTSVKKLVQSCLQWQQD